MPAQPNMHAVINPRGTTWVMFGKAGEGEFFDITGALEPARIVFPANVRSPTVTLNEESSWAVKNNIMMVDEERAGC